MSSLISFISVLYFSVYSSFVSSDRFIPKYLILFVAVMNGIDSLISLSDKEFVVHIHNGILLGNIKECI